MEGRGDPSYCCFRYIVSILVVFYVCHLLLVLYASLCFSLLLFFLCFFLQRMIFLMLLCFVLSIQKSIRNCSNWYNPTQLVFRIAIIWKSIVFYNRTVIYQKKLKAQKKEPNQGSTPFPFLSSLFLLFYRVFSMNLNCLKTKQLWHKLFISSFIYNDRLSTSY